MDYFQDDDDQGRWHAEIRLLEQYREESQTNHKEVIKMALTVKESSGGGNYAPAPAGAHIARCYRIVDLGTQENTFKGEVKKQHQIMISWELPNELMTDGEMAGKPFTISQRFTASLSEKAKLRAVLESWRGRKFTPAELNGFNLENIIGKPCMINIVHVERDGKSYANIASVMQIPGGMVVPNQVNPSVFFSLESFDAAVFNALPKRTQETIQASEEYASAALGKQNFATTADGGMESDDDDIPF